MNPDIKVSSFIAGNRGEEPVEVDRLTYIAEKGVPILIPEYKFISE
jgi:hypothetical protein